MRQGKNKKNKSGFTLIELMVSISIFVIVAFIATSIVLQILDAGRRANKIRLIVDNMNFALDSMTVKMKFGKVISVDETFYNGSVQFYDRESNVICYKKVVDGSNGSIHKCIDSCNTKCNPITTSEINVTGLSFKESGCAYAGGIDSCKNKEIVILVNAQVNMKNQITPMQLDFQTAVSQSGSVEN